MGNRFSRPAKTNGVSGAQSGVINTQIFSHPPTHPPVGKKMSLINFKHKITTIQTALLQDIRPMTKNCVCTVKYSRTISKSVNQIRPVLMP